MNHYFFIIKGKSNLPEEEFLLTQTIVENDESSKYNSNVNTKDFNVSNPKDDVLKSVLMNYDRIFEERGLGSGDRENLAKSHSL